MQSPGSMAMPKDLTSPLNSSPLNPIPNIGSECQCQCHCQNLESQQQLPQKYQTLATEYAKLRSSAAVLKRGLLQEQAKTKELTDDLLTRDQIIRKRDQEIDSLGFRNTQLEKRVGFLQEELELAAANIAAARIKSGTGTGSTGLFSNHKSSTSSNSGAAEYRNAVPRIGSRTRIHNPNLNSELITKIEENMQLQRRISELEKQLSQVQKFKEFESREELETKLNNLNSQDLEWKQGVQNMVDGIEAYRDEVGELHGRILELYNKAKAVSTTDIDTNHGHNGYGDLEDLESKAAKFAGADTGNFPCSLVDQDYSQESLLDKLKSVEMDKEQLGLEYHLMEARLKKALEKIEEMTKIHKSLGYPGISSPNLHENETTSSISSRSTYSTIVGSIESEDSISAGTPSETSSSTNSTIDGSTEIESNSPIPHTNARNRIPSVKHTYLMSRIQTLVNLLQESDSRAITFYDEVKNMEKLLVLTTQRKLGTEEELRLLQEKYQSLEEDLDLIKRNYEGQLEAMSEHVVELNEKLLSPSKGVDGWKRN